MAIAVFNTLGPTGLRMAKPGLRALVSSAILAALYAMPARAASDVVQLQTQSEQTRVEFPDGGRTGSATLTNLNRQIGAWYVLEVRWASGERSEYHLELPYLTPLRLTNEGLWLGARAEPCTLPGLRALSGKGEAYVPVCGRDMFVRQKQVGATSLSEWGANLLRSQGLEAVVDSYKSWNEDSGFQSADLRLAADAPPLALGPDPALLAPAYQNQVMRISDLDLQLGDGVGKADLRPGRWVPLKYQQGVYFSAIQPGQVSRALDRPGDHANALDPVEAAAVSYMVAFDLNDVTLGWSHGTDLPGVGWSRHFPDLKLSQEAGPDGFSTLQPLVMTGRVNPGVLSRLIATMCGGFQRYHGAISYGPLSRRPHKSYYGFIQEGVVLSTPHPDLATLIVYKDGEVALKTWDSRDDADIHRIRYARQNGVPLVVRNAEGRSVPGEFVDNWGAGNWSGNSKSKLRSQRAGLCVSQQRDRRYLIYGYFSSATPSAMARVMQAYDCDIGMHLDMNSATQSYLGLLSQTPTGQTLVEHPVHEMEAADTVKDVSGKPMPVPRYVGRAEQSDFFYIVRKQRDAVAAIASH